MLALDDKMRAKLELLFKIASRLNITIYDWNDLRVFCTGIRDDIWREGFQLLFDIRHIQDMILKIDLAEYWRLPILPNYQGQGLNFFRMIDRNQSIQTFTFDKQEENDVLIDEYPFED